MGVSLMGQREEKAAAAAAAAGITISRDLLCVFLAVVSWTVGDAL